MIEIPAHLDLDNPRIVARWLWENLPDDVTYKYDSGSGDGSCWIIENADTRFAIGEDVIEGDGLCWSTHYAMNDSYGKHWEDHKYGGWANGDTKTARSEIEYAFGLFDNPPN